MGSKVSVIPAKAGIYPGWIPAFAGMTLTWMSVALRFFSIIFLSFLLFACTNSANLHDTQGNVIQSDALQGKWIIVNYWAGWCHPCTQEIPALNRFYRHHQAADVLLYGVNFDHLALPALQAAARKLYIAFPVLLEDPQVLWHLGAIDVVPTTFIIAPSGEVVKKLVGPNTEVSLEQALAQSKSQANGA